jgi:hypothetical protein
MSTEFVPFGRFSYSTIKLSGTLAHVRCGGRIADDSYLRLTYRGFEANIVETMQELRAEKNQQIFVMQQELAELRLLVNALLQELHSR